jgi:HSP20 family protein
MNALKQTERNRQPTSAEPSYLVPQVDIGESNEEYFLEADMPGVSKDGLEVLLEGNELTLTGHRQPAPPGEVLHRESNGCDYRRTFVLDPKVDATKIRATIEQGLLRVYLPKAEKVKPRKISVTD